jgi:hypothetical protein
MADGEGGERCRIGRYYNFRRGRKNENGARSEEEEEEEDEREGRGNVAESERTEAEEAEAEDAIKALLLLHEQEDSPAKIHK